ncbi:MAG: glutamate 5-kinase [Armatimonadetes bacterium]|nr:glutamate 5-kinase [Anaerolineae bacterium]
MRIVVKLGTSTLTGGTPHLNRQRMLEIVQQVAVLHQQGHAMVLVSSGAQAAGRETLGFPDFGRTLPVKQMLSAVGQGRLMHYYSELFEIFNIAVGQVLLTRDDLTHRTRYLNCRDTLDALIEQRIIPIINENDTTATSEIKVGDNDNLSAMVATTIEAGLLVIITDMPGLFTADPRKKPDAQLISVVERIDEATYALAGGTSTGLGTGGMVTKIEAAHTASRGGIPTVLASGKTPDVLLRVVAGDAIGTRFAPISTPLESRKRWLLTDTPQGAVKIDAGAVKVLNNGKSSLLPVGVTAIVGDFERGATVSIVDLAGAQLAHGMCNYSADELRQLVGVKSDRIAELLGYTYGDYVIHRNNMVMLT